jgi:hypothetical protein
MYIDPAERTVPVPTYAEPIATALLKALDVWGVPSIADYLSQCPMGVNGIAINLNSGCILTTKEYHANPAKRTNRLGVKLDGGIS